MKNTLIESGVYKLFLNYKKELYLSKKDYNDKCMYLELIPDIESINECFRIYNANRDRKRNNFNELCKWYYAIMNIPTHKKYKIIFGTLTFNDESLDRTSKETRRRYVTRFLNDNTYHYIANIDYGELKQREHYHFIAMVEDRIDCNKWKYGASKFQFVPFTKKDIKSTKNYLFKLNNHSYKESTKQERIIKDRKEDSIIDFYIDNIATQDFHRFKLLLNSYE